MVEPHLEIAGSEVLILDEPVDGCLVVRGERLALRCEDCGRGRGGIAGYTVLYDDRSPQNLCFSCMDWVAGANVVEIFRFDGSVVVEEEW